ncbi:Fe-S cluster biogenesis protein NfuA, 4Fe-4S-binding domain [Halapricum desulfuricans]|uniref:Fe-S cluster biogenesis protein NfuA, 4Fe-4S-binding domain n=1 Tax=Halapricum desulfuricans TaxID=2841257 RepID=A0A897NK07_9EURY|nr:Fe-S cluster biogenesis protein NfuA, 4Fe-4S-binding domain [Halapricum desulfuricans]
MIRKLDPEKDEIMIALDGACSGCGISPMTIQAIKTRMTKGIPEIETVHADTGADSGMGGAIDGPTLPRGQSRGG